MKIENGDRNRYDGGGCNDCKDGDRDNNRNNGGDDNHIEIDDTLWLKLESQKSNNSVPIELEKSNNSTIHFYYSPTLVFRFGFWMNLKRWVLFCSWERKIYEVHFLLFLLSHVKL